METQTGALYPGFFYSIYFVSQSPKFPGLFPRHRNRWRRGTGKPMAAWGSFEHVRLAHLGPFVNGCEGPVRSHGHKRNGIHPHSEFDGQENDFQMDAGPYWRTGDTAHPPFTKPIALGFRKFMANLERPACRRSQPWFCPPHSMPVSSAF